MGGSMVDIQSATAENRRGKRTKMWVDAQRYSRPAKYRWRPLLNAVDQIAKIFAPDKIPLGARAHEHACVVYQPSRRPNILQRVGLTSVEQRQCSNLAKTRNPLKFAGVSQTRQPISAVSRPKFTILWEHVVEILLFNTFFRLLIHALKI